VDGALTERFFSPVPRAALYVLWHDKGDPIYVGQSRNVFHRLGQHFGNGEKRRLTQYVQVYECESTVLMKQLEVDLIDEYRPPLNKQGNLDNAKPAKWLDRD
jgi:excinuclease UvrABC nuclease subunit